MLPQIPPFHNPFDDLRYEYHHHLHRRRKRRFNRQSLTRGCGAVLALLVAVVTLSTTLRKPSVHRHYHAITSADSLSTCRHGVDDDIPTIYPGELPGYTGWSRPEDTMARYFSLVETDDMSKEGTTTWSALLKCERPNGRCCYDDDDDGGLGPQFFVRAYGPSVLTGTVIRETPNRFRVEVPLVDPGVYTMEVILTFSNVPSWTSFPLDDEEMENVAYEGYMLPGFPLMVTVCGEMRSKPQRWCSKDDLYWNESQYGPSLGRWKVMDKNTRPSHHKQRHLSKNNTNSLLTGYQHGFNSLGIRMDYQPTTSNCQLFNHRDLISKDDGRHILDHCLNQNSTTTRHRHLSLIFIGDSVMARQKSTFESQILSSSSSKTTVKIETTFLSTHGGISQTLPRISEALHAISRKDTASEKYVIFNTGLHDVARLCSRGYKEFRREVLNMTTGSSCVERYREDVGRLVDVVRSFPARLRVFRTTTAAWPKYGNYGFAWPVTQMQILPFATEFARVMNDVAISVILRDYKKNNNNNLQSNHDDDNDDDGEIKILDAYWLSHSRPDHTEVVSDRQEIGKHLVHPGVEVLYTMSVQWFMVLLGDLCKEEVLEGWIIDGGDN